MSLAHSRHDGSSTLGATSAGVDQHVAPSGDLRWHLHGAWVALLLSIMVCRAVWPAFQSETFGIEVSAVGDVTIRDLPAHLTFAHNFWCQRADYSVASHLRATDAWAGQSVGRALPFGYSPTMFWLLGPFCLVPTAWGYVAWSLLSAAAVWWLTRRGHSLPVVTPLVLLSPLGLACFVLGQTAFLAGAAMLLLMVRHLQTEARVHESAGWRNTLGDALLLWALAAKPPLAIAAGVALLAGRRWRPVVMGGALTAVTTLILTPLLGWDWPTQYLHLMSSYNRQAADAAFAWSLRPDHMSNLRSLLWYSGVVGDALAARLSTLVWLATSAGLVVLGLRHRINCRAIWPLAVLSFLLFCPHVTSTEDLLLVVAIAAVANAGLSQLGKPHVLIAALALLVVWLAPEVLLSTSAARTGLLFTAKLCIAVAWLYLAVQQQNEVSSFRFQVSGLRDRAAET